MKFEAATLKDIARALDVSMSTVSRALRDSHEISGTTKQLVVDYAKKVNYRPNPIAVSLRAKKSKSIGIIVSEIANNFFSQVINGIESVANRNGYNVIITQTLESYINEVNNTNFLASRSIDGCLVSISSETKNFDHFKSLQDKGFPIVFFDRIIDDLKGHCVTIDNMQATYEGIIHLLQNNYRKIAFIANSPDLCMTAERLKGYKKALFEYGIPYDKSVIKYCMHGGMYYDEIEFALSELFMQSTVVDAVFASTDKLTTSTMHYCQKNNIEIPAQVALAGFSNLDINDLLNPSLTVVKQPAFQMGKTAAELLIKTIESRRPVTEYEQCVLEGQLCIGKSTSYKKEIQYLLNSSL